MDFWACSAVCSGKAFCNKRREERKRVKPTILNKGLYTTLCDKWIWKEKASLPSSSTKCAEKRCNVAVGEGEKLSPSPVSQAYLEETSGIGFQEMVLNIQDALLKHNSHLYLFYSTSAI
jgi:hypothetical protein